jgi:hypothetical protein
MKTIIEPKKKVKMEDRIRSEKFASGKKVHARTGSSRFEMDRKNKEY